MNTPANKAIADLVHRLESALVDSEEVSKRVYDYRQDGKQAREASDLCSNVAQNLCRCIQDYQAALTRLDSASR